MHTGGGEGTILERVRRAPLACMCAAAQTANKGQEGGGAGHAGRGRNAARWLSSLRALLICWLPAALLHWRRAQRGLASELSSGMPDDHDTALHSTRDKLRTRRRRSSEFLLVMSAWLTELLGSPRLVRCFGAIGYGIQPRGWPAAHVACCVVRARIWTATVMSSPIGTQVPRP